jgi:hypothetical protein
MLYMEPSICNNISNLFVVPFNSHHTAPLTAKKLWPLRDTNGIQELHMGCTKMLLSDKNNSQVHFTDQQHAISTHLQYIKLTAVQNIFVLQNIYGFAETHNYINAQWTGISSTLYHNGLTYIVGLWMFVTTGQEMFLQNMFVSERLTAHITAIWTLPSMCTLMDLKVTWSSKRFITHITAIWTLPSMYKLMYL